MPTLNWIGKDKVVSHHQDVPYRILKHCYGYNTKGKTNESILSGNKIIKGDNLEALKSLLPEYEGKIKCIYIDPPYNTGNESWVYNDNVNHPKIQKWLGEVVGKEGEDFTRHDKWLCMMYPRLRLLHRLLSDDGVIFISIDDNEQTHLKLLCDEIFGNSNFISNNVRQGVKGGTRSKSLMASNHDYITIYCKNRSLVELQGRIVEGITLDQTDSKGMFKKGRELNKWGAGSAREDSPTMWFPIKGPDGSDVYPIRNDGSEGRWRWGKKKLLKAVEDDEVLFEKRSNGSYIVYEKLRDNSSREIAHSSLLIESKYSNAEGSKVIKEIFEENKSRFSFPKPIALLEHLVKLATKDDSIILDSFAGSGTTAHAVLNLNNEDGGNRKFILVEMEEYAEDITAERVKRVIKGYGNDKKKVDGTGGSFDFYELGEPIFKDNENLNEEVGEDKIRNYIYYTETKQPLTRPQSKEAKYLLDNYQDTGYYFYYEKDSLTTLDNNSLGIISELQEQYIIYADICLLDEQYMLNKNIIFKKIPRDIKRF